MDPSEGNTRAIVSLIISSDVREADDVSKALEQRPTKTMVRGDGSEPTPGRAAMTWIYALQPWSSAPARRQLDAMIGYIEQRQTAMHQLQGDCRFRLSVGISGGGDVPPENLAVLPDQLATLSALRFEFDVSVYFL